MKDENERLLQYEVAVFYTPDMSNNAYQWKERGKHG